MNIAHLCAGLSFATAVMVPMASLAEQASFVGNWHMTFECDGSSQTQYLQIVEASATKVKGVMHVTENNKIMPDRRGDIVSGKQVGPEITFPNAFSWGGGRFTQDFAATLASNGNSVTGAMTKTNFQQVKQCSIVGKRAKG